MPDLLQWTPRDSNPDCQHARLASSPWTRGPLSCRGRHAAGPDGLTNDAAAQELFRHEPAFLAAAKHRAEAPLPGEDQDRAGIGRQAPAHADLPDAFPQNPGPAP